MSMTAYKPEQYLRHRNSAVSSMNASHEVARVTGMPMDQLLKRMRSAINGVPAKPATLRAYLEGYMSAILHLIELNEVWFLYKVPGAKGSEFYSIGSSQGSAFPNWRELPREMWGELGQYGGLYWKTNLKPYSTEGSHTGEDL